MGKKTILIIGGDSAIGASLANRQQKVGNRVITTTRRPGSLKDRQLYLDIEKPELNVLCGHRFDVAVFCAGITSIHACELLPEYAHRVNVLGTTTLANYLVNHGTHIVFLSTNLVFDGSSLIYTSDSVKNPVTEYGKQKALVEDWIGRHCPRASIIRFGKVLPKGFELFNDWRQDLLNGSTIRPYIDKHIAPISTEVAIQMLCLLIETEALGIFQATALHSVSYSVVGYYLAMLYNAEPSLIKPVNSINGSLCVGSRKKPSIINETLAISELFKVFSDRLLPLDAVKYSVDSAPCVE